MKTTTLILSLVILFKPIAPLMEYAAFYDYIKNELCENKNEPKLECNGKCYLKKELAKASESESDKEKKHISAESNLVFYEEIEKNFYFQPPLLYTAKLKTLTSNGNLSYSYLNTDSIFRPPIK
ncbi:MAG: hypothetical protein ACTH5N_06345 [Psychroflexus halocasei]|uniref:hypothetical protein n=1 Tax=Psychroflexus sp. S27 TaxID=1982757 RepID=UPI001EDE4D26|nr:hypothetical protein [Psychroflexus sp. S27]MDN6290789.1 hypothetical protein [Tetragenococcus koreensis]